LNSIVPEVMLNSWFPTKGMRKKKLVSSDHKEKEIRNRTYQFFPLKSQSLGFRVKPNVKDPSNGAMIRKYLMGRAKATTKNDFYQN
ncbi:MAG: hypothetical protein LUC43_01960, partial [Burkholderiales bacterium]|nr:hypothetical protein [Burkholderiales bacterium]